MWKENNAAGANKERFARGAEEPINMLEARLERDLKITSEGRQRGAGLY